MTRYRTNPACAFLLRAFLPGDAALLRSWSHKATERGGEWVQLAFDLADDQARRRADELVRGAPSYRQVAIGRRVIRDIDAAVAGDTLTVDVLLMTDRGGAR